MGQPSLNTLSKQLKKLARWVGGVSNPNSMSDLELANALGVSNMSVATFIEYYNEWAKTHETQQKVAKKAAEKQSITALHFKKALKLQKKYLEGLH